MDNSDLCKMCTEPRQALGLCARHYQQDYHRRNREKRNAQNAAWRERNPEYWRDKDQDAKRAADKRYSDKNRARKNEIERLRRIAKADAIHLERTSPAGRERNRKNSHTRRARVAGVRSVPFTDSEMLELYGTDCYLCLEPIDLNAARHPSQGDDWRRGLQREHVIPLSKGGEDVIENARPSHALCNLEKGSST